MGNSKLYYALLDLKKVVISIFFNVMIYIEFELFFVSCQLNFVNRDFFVFLASSYIFCLPIIESCCLFYFFSTQLIVDNLHNMNTKQH